MSAIPSALGTRTSIKLVVRRRVPSLNVLFAMSHWQRTKEKNATQAAFKSALRAIEGGLSTPIIWRAGVNTSLIVADTPNLFQTTGSKT
jgi:hypothetical protein